ncbi:Uncharacterized protein HZ326_11506 [Fusarium oxysporum f. sp. albedinis]|nr:Uncharacterized protein HZ326_11506 [Fusarium oxysporum f. sp. albedinis]
MDRKIGNAWILMVIMPSVVSQATIQPRTAEKHKLSHADLGSPLNVLGEKKGGRKNTQLEYREMLRYLGIRHAKSHRINSCQHDYFLQWSPRQGGRTDFAVVTAWQILL